MNDSVIVGSGIHKAYHSGVIVTPVLRGADLSIARGECVYLTGPSGSGKTTLLSILGCVLTPDSGSLHTLGCEVSRLSSAEQARFRLAKIGFVFQRFHLFEALTALENVMTPLDLLGVPRRRSRPRAAELLSIVGLADRAHYPIPHLSMGQKQRVSLARALASDPEIVLADEPTASLDAESGHTAMTLLKQCCAALEKTVVVVTHDSRIFHMADRILTLVEGRIVSGNSGSEKIRIPESSGGVERLSRGLELPRLCS